MKYSNPENLLTLVMLFVLTSAFGCSNSTFSGGSNSSKKESATPVQPGTPAKPGDASGSAALTCDQSSQAAVKVSSTNNGQLSLTGEVCPNGSAKSTSKNVILVVDVSESTKDSDPKDSSGSCGRLSAAQALLATFAKQTTITYNIGIVTFSSDASVASPMTPLAQANSLLNAAVFCQVKGRTNYQAAFESAGSLMASNVTGHEIYLMTDGIPNITDTTPASKSDNSVAQQGGATALAALKAKDANLILNVVYLNADGGIGDGKTYLTSLTGNPARVAVVSSAQELAAQIVNLSNVVSTVNPSSIAVTLDAPGQQTQTVSSSLASPAVVGNTIHFTAASVTLLGGVSNPIVNKMTVKVTDVSGAEYTATYSLSY